VRGLNQREPADCGAPCDEPAELRLDDCLYDRLRVLRERGPVVPILLHGHLPAWFVSRPVQVAAACRDHRLSSAGRAAGITSPAQEGRAASTVKFSIMAMDPPEHTRLRRMMAAAFTPRRIASLRPRIQAMTDALLDQVAWKGNADLVAALAIPLPMAVICELLGIPIAERPLFERLADDMLRPAADDSAHQRIAHARERLCAYLADLVDRKRTRPADDLLTALLAVRADGGMSERELVEAGVLLLVAGYETTVNLIGSGIVALLRYPQQLSLLRSQPGLLPTAVEELLRFDGPVALGVTRYATQDTVIADTLIPAGERVVLGFGAANHDPTRFARPTTLDITRNPNPHFGFGGGAHYCLGAPLARLEAEIALGAVLYRLPGLTLACLPADLQWRDAIFRGPQRLPVAFHPSGLPRPAP
jgi:cytochrome P450